MLNAEILEQIGSMADEKLIEQIRSGNADAFSVLIYRYEEFLNSKVNSFDSNKTQHDDYMQEAVLSFFTAVNTYDGSRSSFDTYLNVCVTRALISFKRKLNRHYESQTLVEDDSGLLLEDRDCDPQNVLENREQIDALMQNIKMRLSDLELKVLVLYLSGGSYDSIAKGLGTTAKSVDNALQRARIKLKNRI